MAKKCVVNNDSNGNPKSVLVQNLSNLKDRLTGILGRFYNPNHLVVSHSLDEKKIVDIAKNFDSKIPLPSLAVSTIDSKILEDSYFGKIHLFIDPSILDSTYNQFEDFYTPTVPMTAKKENTDNYQNLINDLKSKLSDDVIEAFDKSLSDVDAYKFSTSNRVYQFLYMMDVLNLDMTLENITDNLANVQKSPEFKKYARDMVDLMTNDTIVFNNDSTEFTLKNVEEHMRDVFEKQVVEQNLESKSKKELSKNRKIIKENEYGEAKALESIPLSNFKYALIPTNTSAETLSVLYTNNIDVVRYDSARDKLNKLEQIVKNDETIRFQKSSNENKKLEALDDIVSKLEKTGLANEVHLLSNKEMKDVLADLGVENTQSIPNGFVHNGNVYLNEDTMSNDTPIHEFQHLYSSWLKMNKPVIYDTGIALVEKEMSKTNSEIQDVIDHVIKTQPDLEGEALHEEILAELVGRRADSYGKSAIGKWLRTVWDNIMNVLGISNPNMTIGEYADMMLDNLTRGENLTAEKQDIVDKSKANDSFMKAPNGNTTNLTESQWIDTKTASFKNWFRNSKVVDENGDPLVVYHAGEYKNEFKTPSFKGTNDADYGIFFMNNKSAVEEYAGELAEFNKLDYHPSFLKLKNPFVIDVSEIRPGDRYTEHFDEYQNNIYQNENIGWEGKMYLKILKDALANGHDGVIFKNTIEANIVHDTYVAFNPSEIKSAERNTGEYSDETNDIRFQMSDFIPSELFENIKSIPFITPQQALDIYKNIYRPNMTYWQNGEQTNNVNRETGEPSLFYKGDNGEVYSLLKDALQNSANSYSVGFMNNEGVFESFAENPVYDANTTQGKIQNLIKNEYLKEQTVGENTYEAQDSFAAEMVEESLLLNSPFGYERNGLEFKIEDKPEGTFKQNVSKFGIKTGLMLEGINKFFALKNEKLKPKDAVYTREQLAESINSFMNKVGLSQDTIDNYTLKYKLKNGVEPTVDAMIDINNKIIATITGEATLDQLSEEVSHFIIEAFNQDEINRLLPYVQNSNYYAQFADIYREAYSKQNTDPDIVEQYVRKEILGKMLAESLQRDFTLENKSEMDVNFFGKLMQMFRDFLSFIQNKVKPSDVNEIHFFNEQIKNLLYNEELDKYIDTFNPDSNVPVMYSLSPNINRALSKLNSSLRDRLSSNKMEEELAIDAATQIFTDRMARASSLLSEIEKHSTNEETVVPQAVTMASEALLADRDSLEFLKSETIKTAKGTPELVKKVQTIADLADMTLRTLGELSGQIQSANNKDLIITLREIASDIGVDNKNVLRELENNVETEEGIKVAQRDISMIAKLFGHVGKLSNSFANLMSSVIKRLHNEAINDTREDFRTYFEKLIPHRELLKKFISGGEIVSIVNSDKLRTARLKFEYDIRKKIGDSRLDDIDEEKFIKDYTNIDKIEKNSNQYYAYDYEYKKAYSSQPWAEESRAKYYDTFTKNIETVSNLEDLRSGTDSFYVLIKNLRDRVNKQKPGTLARKAEIQSTVETRRKATSIFESNGSLKEGLKYVSYGEAKGMVENGSIEEQDVVSMNPKAVPFASDTTLVDSDYVVVRNIEAVKEAGEIAFSMLKWNQLNLSGEKTDSNILMDNFTDAYERKKREIAGLSETEKVKELSDWMMENVQFDMDESYWDGINKDFINIKQLRKAVPILAKQQIDTLESELNKIKAERNSILKVYKNTMDYKEIDAERIPSESRMLLETLDLKRNEVLNALSKMFEDNGVDMYANDMDAIIEFNGSFYDVFKKVIGKDYENSTLDDKKRFFRAQSHGMSAEKYAQFLNFEKMLLNTTGNNEVVEKYRRLAKDPNSPDSIKEAYLKTNAPIWYRRYDANSEYGSFIRDLNTYRLANIEEMLDQYTANRDNKLVYNGKAIDQMQMNPAFRFTLPVEQSASDLYETEYLKTDNLKDKFDILMRMAGQDKLVNFEKENLNWITNDANILKVYIDMMDGHLHNLTKFGELNQNNVFLRPQERKGHLERYETFFTKGDKKGQIIDAIRERFRYREDDFEDMYKEQRIPKYGLYKINSEELTDDILGSLIWHNDQANLYANKIKYYGTALKAMNAIERQDFDKGKKGVDTNLYKVAKEMLDYNFYGKTTTMKMETEILGQKIDMAKVLMWFKGFAVKQALGFSPIVALTNVASGITQHQFAKWTGKNIYSIADDRAMKLIAPLTSDSLSDIGSFDPKSKLNKILYSFGVYNISERFKNSQYSKAARLLPQSAFSMMAVGNFTLQSRVALAKLMEYRLIDGQFKSWREFSIEEKTNNPTKSNSQLRAEFDKYSENSMYDYLDQNGELNQEQLTEAGYSGNIRNDKSRAMSAIANIGEQVTMEIKPYNEGQAARDPLWSFALSLKKWLILANSTMFSRKRTDIDLGGKEEGLLFSYKYLIDVIKTARKDGISFAESYNKLDELERSNLKSTSIITASMITLLSLAFMLKKMADDDDEKDNYGLQLASYMMLRNLNETFSANIGVGNSLYESLQSPIMTANTLSNTAKLFNFGDIGQEISRGKYKGMDKYAANWIKLTAAKNLYTVKDANSLFETRKGYEFFTQQQALYHIFNMLPKKDDSGN